MAKPSKDELFTQIRQALAMGVQEFLATFRTAWPDETMYSFLFELPCEGTHAHAAAATEEGLVRVAKKYADLGYRAKRGDTPTALQTGLRWAGPEDGWFQGADHDCFVPVSRLLDIAFNESYMAQYDEQLNNLALATLRELDTSGVFGVGETRERMVLGMCYIGGDNSDDEFIKWTTAVNPPSVISRLQKEMGRSRAIWEQVASPYSK